MKQMILRLLSALLVLAYVSTAGARVETQRLDALLKEVSEITGLKVKRKVPGRMIGRSEWKRWVDDEVRRTVKPEEIRADELALRLFGLIPRDFDLRKATVDLLGEQAAAVYDPKRKQMLVVEGASPDGLMADMVLVHELAHALADQHFDLKAFLEKGSKTGEDSTARLAVAEGQAMWVMLEWQVRKTGASLRNNRAALDMMLPMMGKLAAEQYPVFSTAPLYLKETLLFPYSAGILFQQAAVERSPSDAFIRVLRNPPVSTRQILHPETWFNGENESAPPLPPMPRSHKNLTEGTLGELDLRILLEQFISIDEARRLSPAWRAGAFAVSENKSEARATLRWSLLMASEDEAARLLEHWARMIEKKAEGAAFTERTSALVEGTNQDGGFRIVRTGAVLTGVEGSLPTAR